MRFVNNGKVKAMHKDLLFMTSHKIVATDNSTLGVKRILPFANIGIVVLGVKNLTWDAELVQ